MTTKEITMDNSRGLDGAASIAMLVQIASRFNSRIYIESGKARANAKSIMGMMNLTLSGGETLRVCADGTDERSAVAKLEEYMLGKAEA
ncbi:MAG: HPr family phosphocarrier protein [Lachnospiraceae bacterium]|nr:HPr family phosphocarrier protein [Lachnospiraceae bacterium]